MNKQLITFTTLALLSITVVFSQKKLKSVQNGNGFNTLNGVSNDSINKPGEISVELSGTTKYTDYKVFSHKRDTTYVDTTLTLEKEYKFNFLRKDNFELLAFHNQGQTFNNLGYSFNNLQLLPDIGFTAQQFSYLNTEDIKYYEVPTPTSEILYRTGMQQGQVLDAFLTANFSERLNVSLAYKGLRSLGEYRQSLASKGHFRGTFQYRTKNNKYQVRAHYAAQDFLNQESGGLTPDDLQNFILNDPNFSTRARLDVNLKDAENEFEGARTYLEHSYKLVSSKDSVQQNFNNIKVGHIYTKETKYNRFSQGTVTTAIFGDENDASSRGNEVTSSITNNELHLDFNSKYLLGQFKAKVNFTNYEYGYDTILNTARRSTKTRLRGEAISVGADWNATIKNFKFNATSALTPGNSRLSGHFLKGEAHYKKDSLFEVKGSLLLSSKSPNFNTLLHQSNYDAFNWENNFSNVNTRDIGLNVQSKWINAAINYTNIDNYTFFNEINSPEQFTAQINYLKAKVNREFKYKKFALDNTVMYQNVSSGSAVFRVPELVTRNTIYYQDYWFKGKPMLVNIGITFKHFTEYYANAYHPILGEFTVQNDTKIGFSTFDVFFNAQVRRTRLYFKVDNATSSFTKKNYFSAPNYPYRDFTIRFGLVWNWFI